MTTPTARQVAEAILNRVNADPDDDAAIVARSYLRLLERDFDAQPPHTCPEPLTADRLAAALNDAQVFVTPVRLGHDLLPIAGRILAALGPVTVQPAPDALALLLAEAREALALRPSGHTGANHEIPWFKHGGISHAEDRPDCIDCQLVARIDAALANPAPAPREVRFDRSEWPANSTRDEWESTPAPAPAPKEPTDA